MMTMKSLLKNLRNLNPPPQETVVLMIWKKKQ